MPINNWKTVALAGVLALAVPRDAAAVAALGDFALETTQWADLAAAISEGIELAHQGETIASQLHDMEVQAQVLGELDWGHAEQDLRALNGLVQRSRALGYSVENLDGEYARRYGIRSDYAGRNMGEEAMAVKYQQWSEETRDNALTALRVAGMQAEDFATEEQTLQQLEEASETSRGRMQALQVGHRIAIEEVRQLQKLRQLMMTSIQMQADRMAAEQDKDAIGHQTVEDANRDLITNPPRIDDGERF
jgi:P-type conjugative transfer protein TrbJ